jgi:hypothetical protein
MRRFLASLILIAGVGRDTAAAQARDTLVDVDVRFRPIVDTSFFGSRDSRWTQGRISRTARDTIEAKICDGCVPSCARCRDSLLTLAPLADWQIQRRRGVGSRGGNELLGGLCGLEIIITPVTAGGGALVGTLIGRLVAPRWEPLLLFTPRRRRSPIDALSPGD